MSLFTKPITQISFEDIQNFINQKIPEGIKVEYKKSFRLTKS